MYYSLRGTLLVKELGIVVVECGGVGYRVAVPAGSYARFPAVGEEAMVYTYLSVREDAMELFGFPTEAELTTYKMLVSVSGVGPKVGLAILSDLSADTAMTAIAAGDYKPLTAAAGVGPKLAQRIVLELKDKVGALEGVSSDAAPAAAGAATGGKAEAAEALAALGFPRSQALAALRGLDNSLSVEDYIKEGLKLLSSQV